MSRQSSIGICVAAISAVLVSLICTELQAGTHAKDCLAAPNASSPRGRHWYYRIDLTHHRKCWYLHRTITHRTAKTSGFAVSSAADASVPGTSANGPLKSNLTPFDSAKSIDRYDPHLARQGNSPPGNMRPLDASKTADAEAISSPAAEKPIQESDAPSIPGEALQIDRTAPSDTASLSGSDAASSPASQHGDPSWISQKDGPEENSPVNGSKLPAASPPLSPAPATFRVAASVASPTPEVALSDELDKYGGLAERSRSNGIAGALSSKRAQIILLIFGLAILAFVISLVVIRRPTPTSVDFQSGRGWQEENARTSRIPVDDARGRNKLQAEAKRPRNSAINSTATQRLYSDEYKAALEDKPTLIYRARSRGGAGMPNPQR
jgi:hypothetical protein